MFVWLAYFYFFGLSKDGGTALIRAANNGHDGVVVLLLDVGANIEAADNVIDIIISS